MLTLQDCFFPSKIKLSLYSFFNVIGIAVCGIRLLWPLWVSRVVYLRVFFFFFLDQKYYTLFLKLFLERQLVFFIEQHCIYIFFLYIFFLLWVFAVVFLPSLVIVSFYSPSFLYYDFYCLAASTGFFFFYLISKSIFTFIFPTWLTLLCVWNSLLCC